MNRRLAQVAIVLATVAMLATVPVVPGTPSTAAAINDALATYLSGSAPAIVPVIVQTKGDPTAVEDLVTASGGHVSQRLGGIHGFIATVSPATAGRLNHDPRVQRINLNAPIRWDSSAVDYSSLVNRYNTLAAVQGAWDRGLDGTGIQVAVIDSGVWPHDDLVQNSPIVPRNSGNRLATLYTNQLATDSLDHVGHGTHVAGIIGGNGYDSGGQYVGVAPNALIVGVKVADDLGNANEGDVITGLDWVLQANQHGLHIRLVNLSLQSTVPQSYNQSALDAMVEKVVASGVTVVAASGNNALSCNGPVDYAPGNDPYAITVGSVDDQYQTTLAASPMACWALYGKTQDGFNKPDVVADGSHVVSLLAPASSLSANHPLNIVGTNYFKMGGTSMAAPQVTGLAALMLQANPGMSPGQVKHALTHYSVPFSTTAYTKWLGTPGGYLSSASIGHVEADDNASNTYSASFNPANNSILAGGAWWADAAFPTASWDNISWSNISWSNISWSNISWSNVGGTPVLVSASWDATSWSNISWSNISWSNISWSNISWSNISWSNISWSDATWS